MLRYKLYRNLDELPIYNWDKVQRDNDLKYLLHLDSYAKPIKISKYLHRDLMQIYKTMVGSLNAKSAVLKAKTEVVDLLTRLTINISKNSKDPVKIEKASKVIRALMIDPSHPDMLTKVDFCETAEQRSELTFILIAIKKYITKIERHKKIKEQSLYEQVAAIESSLGVNIDVHKCSVNMFLAYIKQLKIKITANG